MEKIASVTLLFDFRSAKV